MTPDELKRFIPKFEVNKRTGCWVWQAAHGGSGMYAIFAAQSSTGQRQTFAHRVAYEHWVGPIPKGEQVHHTCENRSCVNPDHLKPMSALEHMRYHRGKLTHCKHGHPFDDENTYINPRGQRECKECRYQAVRRQRAR